MCVFLTRAGKTTQQYRTYFCKYILWKFRHEGVKSSNSKRPKKEELKAGTRNKHGNWNNEMLSNALLRKYGATVMKMEKKVKWLIHPIGRPVVRAPKFS